MTNEYGLNGPDARSTHGKDAKVTVNYDSFNDFAATTKPSWTPGKKRFEWNRYVLDQAM